MFRITPQSYTNTALFNNRRQVSQLADLQGQASSGLKYARPSDNPRETNLINSIRRSVSALQTERGRLEELKSPLNQSVTALVEAGQLVTRARQIGLQATQSIDQPDREVLLAEIDSIINRFVGLANESAEGRYLFSGNAVETAPFELQSDPSLAIDHVQYNGGTRNAQQYVSESVSIQSTATGSEVFSSGSRGETLFLGETGARAGSGTDSYIGRANLVISNTGTSFQPGSGVASGDGSDSIIGPMGSHTLTLVDTSGDGTAGFVSLNNGTEVAWAASDQNIQVTGPSGEQVFLDTSSITPGFSGEIELAGSGSMSIDGGANAVPISFEENQVVSSDVTGGVINVNSQEIRFAGTEPVELTETADAITALLELRDDIANNRGLSARASNESLDRRIGDLERIESKIFNVVGEQSVILQDIESLSLQNESNQLELKTTLGEKESADLASVIVEMQSIQTTMQFNYAALSIVQSNNILDFLG